MDVADRRSSSKPPSDGLPCKHAIIDGEEAVIGPRTAGNGDILCVFGVYKTGTMRAKADAISGKGRRSARRRKTVGDCSITFVIFCLVGQGSAALQPQARPGLAAVGSPLGTTLPVLGLGNWPLVQQLQLRTAPAPQPIRGRRKPPRCRLAFVSASA
ncbi:uncharacterized protein TRIREDRAFT_102884 [Trichoderma reesei QM6a]|uniref:Predicted protein n=2 Tax=Hypocrea jecorina TaxID=51453 RepID=G0R8J5_HYPJQ|nr:uncharacterized protein TRIREDRAFT_102884 [Trichoderma reesei QM6a]EGR52360.1 predicted protein [Trichoderma reesei QM6a]ETS06698.1 hypothetical protein M419DRAFT_126129 [Trichoderma reesei RUT C-30]